MKIAPEHFLDVYCCGKDNSNIRVAALRYFEHQNIIWTEEYGYRKLPKYIEIELNDLWHSIREE